MAFRASELRLILGIQAYGTTNLARLRRDITALGRAADAANANQLRVQDQIVAKRGQIAATTQKIANMENRIAGRRGVLEAQAAVNAERFAARRAALAQRELRAAETLANRQLQISRTRGQIGVMGGSGMQRFAVQEAQLAQRRMGLQNQINTLERQGIGLGAQRLRNFAAQSAAQRALLNAVGGEADEFARMSALSAEQFVSQTGMNAKVREAGLRWHGTRVDAERIAAAQQHLPQQVAAVRQQLEVASEQEKLISARKFEQAAALGRQQEILRVQEGSLGTIEARLAQIKVEEQAITAQEGLTNAQRKESLANLEAQNAALQVEKVRVSELIAEEKVLADIRMREAAAADATVKRIGRAQRQETLGRTVAHAGRTAQFAGLIATGGFVAAGNAAADFNKKAALAGTQMRDVGGTFLQARNRGEQLSKTIMGMMEEFPADAQEMADSAYDIFSSMNLVEHGIVNVTKGYDLMRTANMAAVAGQVSLEEATSAMIVTLNNFDPSLQHVEQTMNEVFSIVRFGQMRLSDFAAAMVPLAPIAKTTGLQLLDVGSALATLTILFKSPQQAAQGLARAIELFQLQPFKEGMHAAGIEVEDAAHRMRPLFMIISDIAKKFPETTTGQRSMVDWLTRISRVSEKTKAGIQGTVQARRAIAGLVTSMQLYDNILHNIEGSQDEFNQAFEAMKETPGVQWSIFLNQMKAFGLVIGEAALPALLKFGDQLVKLAHWVEHLIQSTNGGIIRWAAYGAAILLVGGTMVNMIGSIAALIANIRIATISMTAMEGAATRAGVATRLLGLSVMALMGLGVIAIPIVLQLIKGGEPGLWMLLGGALAGAVGGGMIAGPPGAIVGALTVPLVMEIIAHFQKPDTRTPAKIAYDSYRKDVGGLDWHWPWEDPDPMSFKEFTKGWRAEIKKFEIPKTGEDIAMNTKAALAKPKTLYQRYLDWFKGFTKAQIAAQNDWFDQMGAGEDKAETAARLAKARAKAIAQAHENMENKIEQAIDKLAGVYDKFLDMNKQAFGELFQGPVATGIIGSVFSDINEMLLQFGETIPVPIEIINQDLEIQMKNFDKLREGYAALLKKGVPLEVVQEIQQMGMAGLPFIQGLLQGSGPMFQKWLKGVQAKHKDILKATDIDFDAQLKQWEKYGSDIATKIIDGLSSDAARKVLEGGFRDNVIRLFGATFKKEMAAEIAQSLKEIAEQEAARIAAQKKADAARKAAKAAMTKGGPPLAGEQPGTIDPRTGKAIATTRRSYPKGYTGITHVSLPGSSVPITVGRVEDIRRTPGTVVVNNHGDRYEIHADGVHPKNVTRAMNKNAFGKRHKRRN